MDNANGLIKVGEYDSRFNEVLNINIKNLDIYKSNGLIKHMLKRKHFVGIKYIDHIKEIIKYPDYVGVNPNEKDTSIEFIKELDDNILIGVKLDKSEEYLYVSTMYDIHESKIKRRLHSGRIKKCFLDNVGESL